MRQQQALMRFDPATGMENPYPSHAAQWRDFNGAHAWLFNPWTGEKRLSGDVGDDQFGLLIIPPEEVLFAAEDRYPFFQIATAYGMLWHFSTENAECNQARKILADLLTKDQKSWGINKAKGMGAEGNSMQVMLREF